MAIERIFIPVDYSPSSERALGVAVEMARAFGAHLQVFHCFDEVAGGKAPVGSAGLDPAIRESAEEQRTAFTGPSEVAGVDLEIELNPGMFPAPAVLEAALKASPDLIVIGKHGRKGLKSALLGGVAEKVVREAACPVVIAKAQ